MSADQQIAALTVLATTQNDTLKEIKDQLGRSDQSRSRMHEAIDVIVRGQDLMKNEFLHMKEANEKTLAAHEARLTALETDSKDVKTMRARMEGAGKLGRVLWVVGSALLGIVAWGTGLLHTLFGGVPPRH